MAKISARSAFTVLIIVFYIVFTARIYMLYTGSSRFRKLFQHGFFSQRQAPLLWQWMETSAPQMITISAWEGAKDMQEATKDLKVLKIVDDLKAKFQQDPTTNVQRDSKDGIKIPASSVEADNGTKSKPADSFLSSTLGIVLPKSQRIKLFRNSFNKATIQPHFTQKNDPMPMQTRENNRGSQGLFHQRNHSGDLDGFLNKTHHQVGNQNSSKSSTMLQSVKPRPEVQSKLTLMPALFKKNFKKMPDWETNDVYSRSNESVQTVCAESLRKTKDADFQKTFIPDIQMYLYRDLLNMSEWNRLAHFNNPYGFMEYNYSDVKSAVDLIPRPNITQLLPLAENESCIRCAVVANGGILRGSKMGQEIDSHTYVFRMNGAVTEGYEEDVGNRTSVYVHTAYSLVTSLAIFKKYGFKKVPHDEGIKYVMIPEGLRDFQWLQGLLSRQEVTNGIFRNRKPWTYYDGQFDESRFYVLHPDFLRYIRNRFMTSRQLNGSHWALYRPTNGAFTLFLALHVCDIVDAYGFITENHKIFSNYYFEEKKTKVIFFINHDYNLEIQLWKKFHNAGIIKLYQREGGQR